MINRSASEARVLLVSNFAMPRAAVQVDSGKMMIRWSTSSDDRAWFKLDAAADYWDGEQAPRADRPGRPSRDERTVAEQMRRADRSRRFDVRHYLVRSITDRSADAQ